MSNPASLRTRLLLAGSTGVVLAAIAAAWLLGAAFERAATRALDRRLGDELETLIALAEVAPDGRARLRREPLDERYDRVFSGSYWAMRSGEVALSSRSIWDSAEIDAALRQAGPQRTYFGSNGPREQWLRVAAHRVQLPNAKTSAAFVVAADLAEVQAEARDFRWFAAISVAAIGLALLAVVAVQVGYGLRPLQRVAATLERIRRGESVRFQSDSLPAEVAPLATEVNQLLDEHREQMERARRTADDLAHALKTPLAVLTLESESLPGDFAQRVREQTQRMREVVERRLAGNITADARQRTAAQPVLEALMAAMARVFAERDLQWRADTVVGAFAGNRDDLTDMLGNLLENAGKWARSEVVVHAEPHGDALEITVDDDGAGLTPAEMAQVLQRGVRLDERTPGSGLGLSIVDEIARSYRGELRLARSALGGLRAELRLPLAAT